MASNLGSNIASMLGPSQRAVDRKTAAKILDVSDKTIERMIDRGQIPGFRVGVQWRIMIRDLENYIQEQQAVERARIGA